MNLTYLSDEMLFLFLKLTCLIALISYKKNTLIALNLFYNLTCLSYFSVLDIVEQGDEGVLLAVCIQERGSARQQSPTTWSTSKHASAATPASTTTPNASPIQPCPSTPSKVHAHANVNIKQIGF